MNLLEKLQKDYKDFNISQEVRIDELNLLGYLLSGRSIPMGDPISFELAELKDEDDHKHKKTIPFCYLYHVKSNSGFVLPLPFADYLPYIPKKSKPTQSPTSR